jgi:hypothetical protein
LAFPSTWNNKNPGAWNKALRNSRFEARFKNPGFGASFAVSNVISMEGQHRAGFFHGYI